MYLIVADLVDELIVKYPKYMKVLSRIPRDPKSGTDTESFYRYIITADSKNCALYANLENDNESVTLQDISVPTAGGGTGVLESSSDGWNKTPIYFQVSN